MEITTYVIERNTKIVKYVLSFDENEVMNYINSLKNIRFEDYHVESNNVFINEEPYTPSTIINSTDDLIRYLKNIIIGKFLNLSELNLLFNEYDNKMYSPATMNIFLQLFSLMEVKKDKEMALCDIDCLYRMQHHLGFNPINDNFYDKIDYAKENTKAFKCLGINLKYKAKKRKNKQKTKLVTN